MDPREGLERSPDIGLKKRDISDERELNPMESKIQQAIQPGLSGEVNHFESDVE